MVPCCQNHQELSAEPSENLQVKPSVHCQWNVTPVGRWAGVDPSFSRDPQVCVIRSQPTR